MGNDIALDRLDPETGIQLLSRVPPDDETPEQVRLRQFWRHQFEMQLKWRAGATRSPQRRRCTPVKRWAGRRPRGSWRRFLR